ncbi:hypothetical protein M099_2859 [Phocaeicola vulgatus str. 3975 RP4]|uniref:Uncharacterized protein n=1 Tax=Phocaeicola vulgatus str. 3975 RP4 TaxID=1339352 RepID=A0A069SGN4_PHOVU|nr:hypothetical protein M099_2859 [Phocaeicola vulgatus str. 3975 RP4]
MLFFSFPPLSFFTLQEGSDDNIAAPVKEYNTLLVILFIFI